MSRHSLYGQWYRLYPCNGLFAGRTAPVWLVMCGALALSTWAKATADVSRDSLPPGALARLGTTHFRHQGEMTFVSFAADGKALITAGRDNTIRLWDLATGKELRRLVAPRPGAAMPPRKIDKADVMELMGGGQSTGDFSVALSANGKILALGTSNIIQLHDVASGKELHRLEGAPAGLASLVISPDSQTLAGRATNGTIHL